MTKKTTAQANAEAQKAAATAKREAAKAKREAVRAKATAIGGGHAAGFINFIREQGVIGLAVGLAVGVAAGASVKEIVKGFIDPIVGFMLGGADLSKIVWDTGLKNGNATLIFGWGAIASSLITLIATALIVYLVVHAAKLDRLDKKKE